MAQYQSNDINDTTDHTHMVFAREEQQILGYEMHVTLSRIVNEYLVIIKASTQSVGNNRAGKRSANNKHNDKNRLKFFKIQIAKWICIFGCNPSNLMFLGAN